MQHLILGTAGHIDHGKTSLIKALTGIDCDTHKQEKERGITINLGFAHLDFNDNFSIGIVDVPGHKDFIKTMIAGASGIKMFLLVIAANEGIMPQTIEHLKIIKALNINYGVAAITKCDIADETQIQLLNIQIQQLLNDFELNKIPIIPVSATTGKGIETLKNAIYQLSQNIPETAISNTFRMYIDRHFMPKGEGSVVTGSVISGKINVNDEVYILPNGIKTKIKNLQRHAKPVQSVCSGDRAAIQFVGIKTGELQKGMLVSNLPLPATTLADAYLQAFSTIPKMKLWTQVIFLCGTFEVHARMHLLNTDKFETDKTIIVQFHFQKPVNILTGDNFIIRNSSDSITLGGGTIIDHQPLHHKKRTTKLLDKLERQKNAVLNPEQRYGLIINEIEKQQCAIPLEQAMNLIGIQENNFIAYLNNITDTKFIVIQNNLQPLITTTSTDLLFQKKILEILQKFHKKNLQLATGLNFQAIQQQLKFTVPFSKIYLQYLLEELIKEKKIKLQDKTYCLYSHQVEKSASANPLTNKIVHIIKELNLQSTLQAERQKILKTLNISDYQLNTAIKEMVKNGTLFFLNNDYLLTADIERSHKLLLQHLSNKPQGINEKEMRELLGCSKRIGQMLLNFFIKEKTIAMHRTFYICITELGKQKILNST